MQRVLVGLASAVVIVIAVFGSAFWSEQRRTNDRLQRLECIGRAHATAAIALLVPDEDADRAGRLDSARTLSSLLDAC